jgi:hypothetical protein
MQPLYPIKSEESPREVLAADFNSLRGGLSSMALDELQTRAVADGIPYQTLISSILHRFVTGRLIEKPRSIKSFENDV